MNLRNKDNISDKKSAFLFDKRKLVVSIAVIVLLFACYAIYLVNNGINVKFIDLKVAETLSKDKKMGTLKINNIKFQKRGKLTVLSFSVVNGADTVQEALPNAHLIFQDKNGNVTYKTDIYINELKAKETMSFEFVLNKKRTKDYTFLISEN